MKNLALLLIFVSSISFGVEGGGPVCDRETMTPEECHEALDKIYKGE